ncbi:MAG TPA: hypothetical protein DCO79_03220 [Spirochaeta sp.]|nr:hypothetical protein [Spirochaeta sp.]
MIILSLTSCRFLVDSDIGSFLKTDIQGHFEDTVSYTTYSDTEWNNYTYPETRIDETFSSDGGYLKKIYINEESGLDIDGNGIYGEGYMDWAEYVGTYSYSSVLLSFEKSYETGKNWYRSEWDYVTEQDVYTYMSEPSEFTFDRNDRKYSYYFAENGFGAAYKPSLGKYTYSYEYRGDDGYFYKYQSDISFIGNKLSLRWTWHDSDVEMPLSFNLSEETELVVRLDDPVIVFTAGQTHEFNGEIESERTRDFWGGDYIEEWIDDPWDSVGYDYSITLTNYGDFIAF